MSQEIKDQLARIAGLTFSDCVSFFAADSSHPLIQYARDNIAIDGEIEIDDQTVLSGSDAGGDYVLAWVWVSNEDAGIVDNDESDDWDEDDDYPLETWQYEVANDDTRLGYKEWCDNQRAIREEEENQQEA